MPCHESCIQEFIDKRKLASFSSQYMLTDSIDKEGCQSLVILFRIVLNEGVRIGVESVLIGCFGRKRITQHHIH